MPMKSTGNIDIDEREKFYVAIKLQDKIRKVLTSSERS